MGTLAIDAQSLGRVYRQKKNSNAPGWFGKVKGLWSYDWREVTAVEDLSFQVAAGESVAFVGPNGAGKSTTIKMLAGILTPSSGLCKIAGFDPTIDRIRVAHTIGTVFGQRSQLWHHLPVVDSCYLLGAIYDMPRSQVRERLDDLAKRFDLGPLLARTAKELSLGERMRCELVASLLHRPSILFLDEPTIGLDVIGKASLRELVRQMGKDEGCTILLTSHDTGDMEQVCQRVIVINSGRLVVDTPVRNIREQFLAEKHISIRSAEAIPELHLPNMAVDRVNAHEMRITIDTRKMAVSEVVKDLVGKVALADLKVEDASMEEVIKAIYRQGTPGSRGLLL